MRWLCPKCRAGFDEHRERCPADNARLVENLSGRIVGSRWSVERLLGVGGGATVWSAMGLETRRPVAIKLARSTDLAEVRRFERGARISGMLDHPHITRVIEHGRDGEYAILAMEQLEGETLKRRIARHRTVTVADAVHIVAQVLDALDYAHFHGIVHRDIKPSNLFISPTPDDPNFVKILDWGIAKFVSSEGAGADHEAGEGEPEDGLAVTQAQQILGTPEFMAPEQIVGGAVDMRSDLYAVGIVLYRLLAGHHPFEAKSRAEMYHAHLMKEPPPLPPGLATGLDAVVRRALAKKPEDRWGNAGAMRRALLAVMGAPVSTLGTLDASSPSLATRPPDPDTTLNERAPLAAALPPPEKRRRRGLVIGAIAGAAAIALALVIALPGGGKTAEPVTAASVSTLPEAPVADQVRVNPAEAPARVPEGATTASAPPAAQAGESAPAAVAAPSAPSQPGTDAAIEGETGADAPTPTSPGVVDDAPTTPVVAERAAPAPTPRPAAPPPEVRPSPAATPPEVRPSPAATPRPAPQAAHKTTPATPIFVDRGGPSAANVAAPASVPSAPIATPPKPAAVAPVAPPQPVAAVTPPPVAAVTPAAATPTPAPTPAPTAPAPKPNVVDAEPVAAPEPPRQVPTGNEIIPFGAGMSRPVRIAGVEPRFTREALEVGVQGTMIVRCVIELDGSLQACKVLKPVAHMETAVLSALATHRYRPIMVQGKPRRVSYVFNINLVQPK